MKRLILFGLMVLGQSLVNGQPIPNYYTRTNFLLAPPAAYEEGLVGFANPANLTFLHRPELRVFWSTDGTDAVSLENWGLFSGFRYAGFSVQRQKVNGVGVTDFRLSTAMGTNSLAFGLAYGWSAGRFDALGREKLLGGGAIWRPSRYFSLGLAGNKSLVSGDWETAGELGIRPFGNRRLTLFSDAAVQKDVKISDTDWSVGAAWQPVTGIHLVGRYFKSEAFTLGLSFNFGRTGAGGQTHFDSKGDYASNTYFVRLGGLRPSFVQSRFGGSRYLNVSMRGRIDYLKYAFFDGAKRFMTILQTIEAAVEDPRIRAIVLNLSSMRIRPEHAWEIREALKSAQEKGKKVIVFLDRGAMTSYHLASVADRVVMDSEGSLLLQGYALSRTYLKGTMEKLGLGFDEWRFFKYKSANEAFSRDSMSEADREQRQKYVDDWYELTRSEVCASRKLSLQEFDRIIDEETYLTPEKALQAGLVDTLTRWSSIDGVVKDVAGPLKGALAASQLLANALPDPSWGTQPKIAVVYALGVCAMDTGIRARWLEQVFLGLAESPSVKAVVFRVDSPGGDGMASDLVAEALKKCRDKKPVIISQGQVAASGGYWLSMYGDRILAGPNTVTGSIGVIGGWVYDKGFNDKSGMTSDIVQRGKRADIGRGVNIPYLNLQVPARNLTEAERQEIEKLFLQLYDVFVKKVAQGRNLTEQRVRQLAEGRIYSGLHGKGIGLVDEIGGLMTAIALAQKNAGLKPSDEVKIVEIPQSKGWFNLQKQFLPITEEIKEEPVIRFLRILTERPGFPLHMIPPGSYPMME
ncbi:MAG: S49 family peptidase [bacterium]